MINLEKRHYETISRICSDILPSGSFVVAFGSRTTGNNRKYSDLDLAVKGKSADSSHISALREAFEESDLPMVVDISLYVDFPDFLCSIIDESGVEVFRQGAKIS